MITLEKAKIVTNHQVTGQQLKNRIKVVSLLTEAVAAELGAEWLFDDANIARPGYKTLDLETEYNGAVFTHKLEKIGVLTLPAVNVSQFRAFRISEGKKSQKRLMLSMTVEHSGSPFELLEHLGKVGRGEGVCTVKAGAEQVTIGEVTNPQGKDVKRVTVIGKAAKPGAAIARYKSNHKSFKAELYVTEGVDGFYFGYVAQVGKTKLQLAVNEKNGAVDSEREALQKAAAVVYHAADTLRQTAKDRSEDKREATMLMEWCEKYLGEQPPLPMSTPIREETESQPN